ncbi:MAG TPA: helicase-related protein [Tepidisphaeraceae bacterium]|nr:helicase-related protein [Tepidisphaeraceae bacterium]
MRLERVRLLVADDVGVGKTVEACLIARELLDRGEVQRMAILCPPHLAEQWQHELRDKFGIDAELVLAGTARRLESLRSAHGSIFDVFPHVIVSTDFIKSDRRRDEFLRSCPELVIIDEAHTCAQSIDSRGARHQRHRLVADLAKDGGRHLVLVTATPHSGDEGAFRSLLALLDPSFANLPDNLGGRENEHYRRQLARHLVQRRRGDIRKFLEADTPFPDRQEREDTYQLSAEYKKLFVKVLNYARESVADADGGTPKQRVRWWSALALLRALASSPAAAAATLRSRAATADALTTDEADQIGERTVLDLVEEESDAATDVAPGANTDDDEGEGSRSRRRRLQEMAREADALLGDAADEKLKKATRLIRDLVEEGFSPIVFCRFIDTATYVADHLARKLRNVQVDAVTGLLAPSDRESRVNELSKSPRHVLVCTDCLSEGINLQQHFDAVVHYDLSWNPTRHEQREGRVDRYGQPMPNVRVLTYYGTDNQIDGIVLDVLLRKHKSIRTSLGISVPVPVNSEAVVKAIFEGLLLRGAGTDQSQLALFSEDVLEPIRRRVHRDWDDASDREKRSRTVFAQDTIRPEEVAKELAEIRGALGDEEEVARFTRDTLDALGAVVASPMPKQLSVELRGVPQSLTDALRLLGIDGAKFVARFGPPVQDDQLLLHRTHPVVEKIAGFVLDAALDPLVTDGRIAKRAGVIRTRAVKKRTTALLLRIRHQIIATRYGIENPLLAEECQLVAFEGAPESAAWLDAVKSEELLNTEPAGNVSPEQAHDFVQKVINGLPTISSHLNQISRDRAAALLASHDRVREATRERGSSTRVEAKLPPDILGIYVYLPAQ